MGPLRIRMVRRIGQIQWRRWGWMGCLPPLALLICGLILSVFCRWLIPRVPWYVLLYPTPITPQPSIPTPTPTFTPMPIFTPTPTSTPTVMCPSEVTLNVGRALIGGKVRWFLTDEEHHTLYSI